MGYKALDRLTREEIQSIKRRTKAAVRPRNVRAAALTAAGGAAGSVIFAEGDSWFDFPPGIDIIDHLVQGHRLNITRFSKHGDTVDNMVYGIKPGTPQIEEFLSAASAAQPRVVLFSGGGNDVMGDEFLRYLNHAASGLPIIRQEVAAYLIHTALRNAIEAFIDRVRAVSPRVHFILHGYGEPFPTGIKTHCGPLPVAGPWIKPSLDKMKISLPAGTAAVHRLSGMFNTMLARLAAARTGHVSYLDLRPLIVANDWRDELHLQSSAFARVADTFAAEITRVLEQGAVTAAGLTKSALTRSVTPQLREYWENAKRKARRAGRKPGRTRQGRRKPRRSRG